MFNELVSSDAWLSQVLDTETYAVNLRYELLNEIENKRKCDSVLTELIKKTPVFVYAKVPVKDLHTVHYLEDIGFRLIETNLLYKKDIKNTSHAKGDCSVRYTIPGDEHMSLNLAYKSFLFSRFHMDNYFSSRIANQLKAEWVKNYYSGKRGDKMVVAVVDEKIIGFLLLVIKDQKTAVIDLVAVDKSYRRQRVASAMIGFVESNLKSLNTLIVGTQASNINSVGLYEKSGFNLKAAYQVLHYHH